MSVTAPAASWSVRVTRQVPLSRVFVSLSAPVTRTLTSVVVPSSLRWVTGPKALDLDEIGDLYWRLHTSPEVPPPVVVHPA